MIAEAGLAALWLAAALSLLQLFLAFGPVPASAGPAAVRSVPASAGPAAVRSVAIVQGALTVFAMAMLAMLFLRSDMSVLLVAQNSHSAKPWLYKLAGAWGNHEGSMLLWVTVLGAAGAVLAIFSRRLDERTFTAALGAQGALALGFYAFLLIASNPFARLDPPAAEGRGLNPLLQDPGLIFHPPTLYLGYVGLSVAFSLAVGALITGRVDSALAKAMRPWVLGAWVLLTVGITAGSYWAYYELGWGGWWFWDPVENASLMPWLAATALLHSVNVLAARESLRAWTVMLAMVAFSMSMIGTFLVRSGILTSVHAFAVDPQRGSLILALLAFYIGAAFLLFALRSGKLDEGARFELVSREAALVGNNLLLTVILGIVFVGTLYPLFVEAVMGDKLSVGAPYFNIVAGPLALILALLIGVGPLLNWRRDNGERLKRLAIPALIGVTVLAVALFVIPGGGILAKFGLGVAAALALASFLPLLGRKLGRTPLSTWGMVTSHFGIAVALAGMAASELQTKEVLTAARPGDQVSVGPWVVEFRSVTPAAGANWTALEAELRASRGSGVK
ncbi:MAG: heme lyase CcmF/NrfE family subunit, partial [Sphingomonas sp.]|nr:heme lyase CcmF/NrfE family subunit [Sphingomonas sp.]